MSSPTEVRQVTEEDQIAGVVRRVARASGGAVPVDRIEQLARESFAGWEEATVRDFLPVLVERAVVEKLGLTASRVAESLSETG